MHSEVRQKCFQLNLWRLKMTEAEIREKVKQAQANSDKAIKKLKQQEY